MLKEYAGTHFKYDARGNLIEKQHGTQVQKLAWDGFNRLAALETPNGKTEYAYDVFGRRIGKRHNGQTTTFVWGGDVIALEKTAEQTRHYLFEAGSFVPLAQVVEKGGEGSSKTSHTAYYHVDHLGTPQLLTDEDGEVAWSAEYKAWGEAKAIISQAAQSAGIDNPIRFQGQYFDAESGLHYNRHRYYDPETGRFISSDPIGLLGGLNTHAYAPNPVRWIDPYGLAKYRHGSNGELTSAFGKVVPGEAGTCTNCSSRAKARQLGQDCDDAGHAIGRQLGGDGGVNGVFPQHPNINRGQFRDFENETADLAKTNSVFVRVVPQYLPGETRPHKIVYQRRVNGKTTTRIFSNPNCP